MRAFRVGLHLVMVLILTAVLVASCAKPKPTPTPVPTPTRAGAATATALPTPTPTPVKAVELKFAHLMGSEGFFSEIYKWWASEFEKRTGGRYKITFYWSNSLLALTDSLPGVGAGIADLGVAAAGYFPAQMPLALAMENPYNAADSWVALKVQKELYEINPDVNAQLDRANVVYAIPWNSGPFQFFTRWPINSLAEVKGKVIRTFGGGRQQMWTNLGAKGIFMVATDIYEAMQRGAIDGYENNVLLADQSKLGEVTNSLYLVYSGQVAMSCFVINKQTFNSFPPDVKDVFRKLQNDWIDYAGERLVKEEAGVIEAWKKKGIRVVSMSDADRKTMIDAANKSTIEILQKQSEAMGTPGKSEFVWQQYLSLVKKYETIVKEQGYPWGK